MDEKPGIQLNVLGHTELSGAGNRTSSLVLRQPKRLALLAYVALTTAEGYRRRDKIVSLFWPDLDQTHARTQLRKAIHALRSAIGRDAFLSRAEDEIQLNPARITCDAVEFRRAVVAGAWADAVALYRGDLLDGLFPGGVGEEFQTWLEQERDELRDLASRACWELSNAADVAGQKDSAIALARRAVDLNPDDEDGVRRLIAALDRHGDRAGAMKVFTSWQAHLEAEYETVPAPETRKLARHVRAARPGESAENTPIKMPPLAPPPVTYPTAARRGACLPMLAAAFAAGIILTISAISLLPLRSGSRPTFPTVVIRPVAATTGGQSQLIADVLAADLASELARAGVSVRPSSGLVQQGETTGDNAYLVSVQVEPRNLARVELIRTSNQSLVWSHVVSRVDDPATRGTLVSELATGIADRLKAAR